jgi:hypothetical protein
VLAATSEAFNSDFYVAAATVIPILFIALLLPGGVMHRYAIWAKKWYIRRFPAEFLERSNPFRWSSLKVTFKASGMTYGLQYLLLPVVVTLIFGSFSEACAMLALANQHATHTEHQWVLWAVVSLPFIAAASSILALVWAPLAERQLERKLLKGTRYAERRARPQSNARQ